MLASGTTTALECLSTFMQSTVSAAVAPHGLYANRSATGSAEPPALADLRLALRRRSSSTSSPTALMASSKREHASVTICRRGRRARSPHDHLAHIVAAPLGLLWALQVSVRTALCQYSQSRAFKTVEPRGGLCLKSSRHSLTLTRCTLLAWTLGVECVATTSGQSMSPLSEVPSP